MPKSDSTSDQPRARSRPESASGSSVALRCLHIVVLSSLAIAQPILDLLARHPSFFVIRRFERIEIFGLVAVVLLLVPLPAVALELVASRLRPAISRVVHLALIGLYGSILALLLIRRVEWMPTAITLSAVVMVGIAAALLYNRHQLARSFVSLLAIALVLIPVSFLMTSGVRKLLSVRQTGAADLLTVRAEAPVVFVIFDEFNLTVLLDHDRKINPKRYPHLAKLAERSTWYRNAVTIGENTRIAVPALLTGMQPESDSLPSLEEHPNNLFTLLAGSHDLWVREPITRMCPDRLNRRTTSRPWLPWMKSLASDIGIVYLHLLLPVGATDRLPSISFAWSDFAGPGQVDELQEAESQDAAPKTRRQKLDAFFLNAISALGDDRGDEIAGFLEPIRSGTNPQLHFLHILLPHRPWEYLADGRRYPFGWKHPIGVTREVWLDQHSADEGFRRYILQTRFLDRFIGRLIERIEGAALFDQSLIVVIGDHGTAFTGGEHRRLASLKNAHEVLPVPLLIKAPFQAEGRIDDRLISTLDLFPTMLEHLGIEPPWPMDGVSLAGPDADSDRPIHFVTVQRGTHVVKPEYLDQVDEAVDRKLSLFGDGSDPMELYRFGPRSDLFGRPVAEFETGPSVDSALRLQNRGVFDTVRLDSGKLPCLLQGLIRHPVSSETEVVLAFALNGTISATTRCQSSTAEWRHFTALLPPEALQPGSNSIEVFRVGDRGGQVELQRLLEKS